MEFGSAVNVLMIGSSMRMINNTYANGCVRNIYLSSCVSDSKIIFGTRKGGSGWESAP
jgi:hypothetical protein